MTLLIYYVQFLLFRLRKLLDSDLKILPTNLRIKSKDENESEIQRKSSKTERLLLNEQFVFKGDDIVVCIYCNDDFKYHYSTNVVADDGL